MQEIQLGINPPHPKQQAFLRQVFRDSPDGGPSITHFVSGRRGGKTVIGVYAILYSAVAVNPGIPHLWTEPTNEDCRKIFLRVWADMVPEYLPNGQKFYILNRSDKTITIPSTGTVIDYLSRESKNTGSEPGRGTEYCYINHDELAKDKVNQQWLTFLPTCSSGQANKLIIVTTSTPKLGWYHKLVTSGSAPYIHATSYDNPYLNRGVIENLKESYSPEFFDQEVMAEWISQQDRAWPSASFENVYPDGNAIDYKYNPKKAYVLACDLGVRSAWLLMQKVDLGLHNYAWVAFAEYTPDDGDTDKAITEIMADWKKPPGRVIVGGDFYTRGINSSNTAAKVFRSRGWGNCRVDAIVNSDEDRIKHDQYIAAERCILDSNGRRRFLVSTNLHRKGNPDRGIREVLLQDTWPERPVLGEFLPKDKKLGGIGLEDMRDAFMYGMIKLEPVKSIEQAYAA